MMGCLMFALVYLYPSSLLFRIKNYYETSIQSQFPIRHRFQNRTDFSFQFTLTSLDPLPSAAVNTAVNQTLTDTESHDAVIH